MFLSTNTCEGKRDCINQCPTKAIKFINGKSFSCLTCGICHKNCPNGAIFQNSYGGYVVDRAKCNGCGMCLYNCPYQFQSNFLKSFLFHFLFCEELYLLVD